MANFHSPDDNAVVEVFKAVMADAMLDNYIDYKIIVNNGQKDIGRVVKNSDLNQFISGTQLLIIINEDVFSALNVEDQKIVAESIIAGVHYDNEKDKLIINKGDIPAIHSGVVRKYGVERYFSLQTLIKDIYSQRQEEEAEVEA